MSHGPTSAGAFSPDFGGEGGPAAAAGPDEVEQSAVQATRAHPTLEVAATHVLGLDVGGTKIAGGLIALPEGRTLVRRVIPTRPERGGRPVLDDVLQLAREITAEGASRGAVPEAVGLGLCELVDRDGRIVSANCIDWINQPVREELSRLAPAHLEADVRAAAIAESAIGAGRRFETFLYVTIGTGISCCLMIGGRPYLGARGATGTMASSPLWIPNRDDGPSMGATLEELASGPALVRRFQAGGGQAATGHDVLYAAIAGQPAACEVLRSAAQALGAQLAVLIGTLDPEALIIGGGLGLSEGFYWEQLTSATRRCIWSDVQRGLPVLRAATGRDAGWAGAAIAAYQNSGGTIPRDFGK